MHMQWVGLCGVGTWQNLDYHMEALLGLYCMSDRLCRHAYMYISPHTFCMYMYVCTLNQYQPIQLCCTYVDVLYSVQHTYIRTYVYIVHTQ